jgi:hypothetical protein
MEQFVEAGWPRAGCSVVIHGAEPAMIPFRRDGSRPPGLETKS